MRLTAPGRDPSSAPDHSGPAAVAARAALLRRLELDVTRRLDGLLSGDYHAFATGPGTEPNGARPYGPGDDARHIDWSLTARAVDPFVRTTDADRELETWFIADRSASLDFGTAQREKRDLVLAGVAAFGFLTARAGNRCGVLIAGGAELVRLPATSGRDGLFAKLSRLDTVPRSGGRPGAGADLAAALATVERTQTRRGQVVIVSDFLDGSAWEYGVRRLANRHRVVAVQINDPREFDLPPVGMLTVVDTETGQRLHVQTNSPVLRARYAAAAADRQETIRRCLARAGVEHLHLSTDREWLIDVVRFVERTRFRARLRGTVRFDRRPGHLAAPAASTGAR